MNREKIRKDWIYFWSEGELESNYSGVDLPTGGSLKFSVGPAIIFALLPVLSFSSWFAWLEPVENLFVDPFSVVLGQFPKLMI